MSLGETADREIVGSVPAARIAVLMTCYNRRVLTLKSIAAVKAATEMPDQVSIFLTDDGGTDGTAEAVALAHPDVTIIRGDGQLYWNGGMRAAWQAALSKQFDFFLWLNDDLALARGSLDRLVQTYDQAVTSDPLLIVVGKTRSENGTTDTYGGRVRQGGLSRLRFRPAHDGEIYCDTMNGNCVLIPARAVDDVGINSAIFRHAMGDIDYGLRARRAGYAIIEMAKPVGIQDRNSHMYSRPQDLSWKGLLRFMTHPKGMPILEWLHFCRSHGGWLWPANFIMMYTRPLIVLLRARNL